MKLAFFSGSAPLAWFGVLTLLAACQATPVEPATTVPPTPSPIFTSLPAATPSPSATVASTPLPTKAVATTPTPMPGFEGWSVVNPQAVEVAVENGSLILTLKRRTLWFMAERGVLVYRPVTGNFKITADVLAARSSDPARPPGGGGSVQLGGLMARNGNGGAENYVFIVVGNDGDGLSIETKTTRDSVSEWSGPGWGSGEAELRLCRADDTFNLYKRHIGTDEDWSLAASFQRPDLPETLQVGVNIYTDSTPDLRVRYDDLRIEPVTDEAGCTTD